MPNIKTESLEIKGLNYTVKKELGTNVFVEKGSNYSQVKLGIYVPQLIKDKLSGTSKLKFLQFKDLYVADIIKKDSGTFIKLPEFNDIISILDKRMGSLTLRVERLLIKSAYEKILGIPFIRTQLSRIETILRNLIENNQINIKELSIYGEKMDRYMKLLKEEEIIEERYRQVFPGNTLIKLQKDLQAKPTKKIVDNILAYILEKDLTYVDQYLKLKSIYSYIRIAATYYFIALNNKELLYTDIPTLTSDYLRIYGKRLPKVKLISQTQQLIDAKIFSSKNNFICGDKSLFESMLEESNKQIKSLQYSLN